MSPADALQLDADLAEERPVSGEIVETFSVRFDGDGRLVLEESCETGAKEPNQDLVVERALAIGRMRTAERKRCAEEVRAAGCIGGGACRDGHQWSCPIAIADRLERSPDAEPGR